jgi:hypothetical protein
MKPKTEQPITVVTLHAHPPERKRRRANEILSQLNGCCCCCCCCLHSVGSLTGAVLGSLSGRRDPAADLEKAPVKFVDDELAGWPPPSTPPSVRLPVNGIYWGSVVVVMILVSLYVLTQATFPNAGAGALFILAIFLPLIQLGASVVSAFVLACSPSYSRERRAWARLWRITLGTFVGAVVGSLIMVFLGIVISASRR